MPISHTLDAWRYRRIPQFSLQACAVDRSGLGDCSRALPFLTTGDVIQARAFKVQRRPPRFVNFWSQKSSTLVRLTDDEASPFETLGNDEDLADMSALDVTKATSLRNWIHERLRKESISDYLSCISEFESGRCAAMRDLVVEVLRSDPASHELVVADGSSRHPARVLMSDPPAATGWGFTHIRVGQWLKLRHVRVLSNDPENEGLVFQANAAQVTRMPEWSFDVACRRQAREASARNEGGLAECNMCVVRYGYSTNSNLRHGYWFG